MSTTAADPAFVAGPDGLAPIRPDASADRLEAIHRKLKAMLAKAESTGPEEAEALLAKAQEWMARYAIDEAVLASVEGRDAPAVVTERTWLVAGPYLARRMDLAVAVASSSGCRVVLGARVEARRGSGAAQTQRLHVIGFETDVEWAEILHMGLLAQLDRAAAVAQRAKPSHVDGRSFNSSFTFGWVSRVGERLAAAARQARADAEHAAASRPQPPDVVSVPSSPTPPPRPSGVALALADKDRTVADEVRRRFPHLRTVTRRATVGAGFRHGRAAGDNAVLAKGAAGSGRAVGSIGRG